MDLLTASNFCIALVTLIAAIVSLYIALRSGKIRLDLDVYIERYVDGLTRIKISNRSIHLTEVQSVQVIYRNTVLLEAYRDFDYREYSWLPSEVPPGRSIYVLVKHVNMVGKICTIEDLKKLKVAVRTPCGDLYITKKQMKRWFLDIANDII